MKTMSFDLKVVKVWDLPDRFRPYSSRGSRELNGRRQSADLGGRKSPQASSGKQGFTQDLPDSFRRLLEKATEELTEKEREAFLSRIVGDRERSISDSSLSHEEYQSLLVRWLKEQANRFMAAAAQASGLSGPKDTAGSPPTR
jgi:hypothetical protein